LNKERVEISKSLLGSETVEMLFRVHEDAKWILESLGVGCKQEVNENFSEHFVKVVSAGSPVFRSAMPMAGISAPYCYNGVLSMTHVE
jgi:hypothetical protein